MKKYFKYAMMGAIALTGAMGFTGCASDDGVAEKNVNPTYNSETNSVTTQFVLNVSSAAKQFTRQSATTVQRNSNFRGMKDAKLIGLATGKANVLAPYAGETTQTSWTTGSSMKAKTYDLGTLYGINAVSNQGNNNYENSSHRVVELTLPLTTDAMLVYGRAISSGTAEDNGTVVYNIAAAPENTTFDLVSRLGDNETKYNHTCNLVALILNRIMLSEVEALATTDVGAPWKTTVSGDGGYVQTEDLAALSWRGLGASTATLSPLQENLATLYKSITGFTTSSTAIRSGSASAVLEMVKDAYSIAKSVYHATPTNDSELNAQRLAYMIMSRIESYFIVDNGAVSAFRNIGPSGTQGTISYALVHNNALTEAQFSTNYGDVTNDLLITLPTSFSLPVGVSQLFFAEYSATTGNASGGFTYTNPSQSLIDISKTLDPKKYMYPSELLYFDNSLLRVNDAEFSAAGYPNGYNVWDTDSWTGWTTGKVTSTTRSVAVKNNINYGVAMLQTSVALKSGVTAFKDNRSEIVTTENDQELSAAEVGAFTLTGVLIGGQYKKLGWNYLAKEGATSNDNYVIYDNSIANNGAIPTSAGNENYTLVFDNYNAGDDGQGDVLVALELQNSNEKDFYGKGGIITKGSKFYLVGKLDLSEATNANAFAWPAYYAIPPYTSGATTETKRVFVQDYMTTATFTIGEESLKNAYSTVPDLRATQTSLGLSVDLNWREGLNFDVAL